MLLFNTYLIITAAFNRKVKRRQKYLRSIIEYHEVKALAGDGKEEAAALYYIAAA